MQARPPVARPDYESAAIAAAASGLASSAGSLWLTLKAGGYNDISIAKLAGAYAHLGQLDSFAQIALGVPVAIGVSVAAAIFWLVSREKIPVEVHSAGGQLRDGAGAAAAEIRREAKLSEVLFRVAGIDFTLDRVRRSFVILGSIGGGKTQAIWNLLIGLREANFKMLIVDGPKGDYSTSYPGSPTIIAPLSLTAVMEPPMIGVMEPV